MIKTLTILALALPLVLKAADTTASPAPAPSFALALYKDGEYDRALLEFQRHLFSEPEDHRARFLEAVCRVKSGQYIRARTDLRTVLASAAPEDIRRASRHLYHYTWYAAGDYRTGLDSLPGQPEPSVALSFLRIMTLCGLHRWDDARQMLDDPVFQNISSDQKKILGHLRKTVDQALGIKKKIPVLSAILSLVPGLGSVYNGRYGDAAFAAGFTGLLYYAGWRAYDKDNITLAAVCGGAALTFHAGHIFGSAATARNGNGVRYRIALAALQKEGDRNGWFRTFGLLPE